MYKAIVTRISVEPIEGFDNLNQGFCGNYKVLVDKSVKTGELGVYFPTDGQLTLEFCQKNNLLRKNPDGSPGGGYFELNMRVKAIKLKKVKSEGFWCPLSYFAYTGYDLNALEEGFQFDELNGHKICNKYYTPATLRQMNANKSQGKKTIRIKKEFLFPEHYDTNQFKHNVHAILPGSLVYTTIKCHGTSGRYANSLEISTLKGIRGFFQKVFNYASGNGWNSLRKEYRRLVGTRHTILNTDKIKEGCGFYKDPFRWSVDEKIKNLRKGEVVYGEIVGYTTTGALIMNSQGTKALKNKEISKRYGDEMRYTYGCMPGMCDFYVYRIAMVNEDGILTELSWNQMNARAFELGLKVVPLLDFFVYDGNKENLVKRVDELVNGKTGDEVIPDSIDPSHISEGVVLRVENNHGVSWYKEKNFFFKVLEGIAKESDDYVDTEEIS
jgi:hypothetical protein